jgi:hypothetical protein
MQKCSASRALRFTERSGVPAIHERERARARSNGTSTTRIAKLVQSFADRSLLASIYPFLGKRYRFAIAHNTYNK